MSSMAVIVTHPERVLFPEDGFTKGDVVNHYRRVADRMLLHIAGRPLTLERFPRGIAEKGFFQKNVPKGLPSFVDVIEVPRSGGTTRHPAVHDADGLAYLANLGAIVFHVPSWKLPDVLVPDRLILDLDPPPEALALVREAAWKTKELLDEVGMPSLPMATGSKGYHLVVPLRAGATVGAVFEAAQSLTALLLHRSPALFTDAFLKAERKGRVLVDWMRSLWTATAVAPYSLRPRARAPMATPLLWEELDDIAPDGVTISSAAERLEGEDPLLAAVAGAPEATAVLARAKALADEAGVKLEPMDRFGRRGERAARWLGPEG